MYDFVQGKFQTQILESVYDVTCGFNSTIFAYRETGSGKTFTMFGPHWDNNPYSH